MALTLAPGITFCEPDGGRIFLDLRNDRYVGLGAAADAAFSRLLGGRPPGAADRRTLASLIAAGLLVEQPAGVPPRACPPQPCEGSWLERNDVPAAGRAIWGMIGAIERAKIGLRLGSLAGMCGDLRAHKARSPASHAADPERIAQIAASCVAASRWVATHDRCLALAFAVARRCLAARFMPALVLGVKLRPFQAHAWVTLDAMVVSDRLDTVRAYTPILIV